MKPDFGDKRALVTGSGKGIGREIARYLGACNATGGRAQSHGS